MVRRATAPALPEDFDIHVIARPERQLRRQEVEVITGLSAARSTASWAPETSRARCASPRAASVGSNPKSPTGRQPGQNRFPNPGELMGVSSKKHPSNPRNSASFRQMSDSHLFRQQAVPVNLKMSYLQMLTASFSGFASTVVTVCSHASPLPYGLAYGM
jgi:hypothetical protein